MAFGHEKVRELVVERGVAAVLRQRLDDGMHHLHAMGARCLGKDPHLVGDDEVTKTAEVIMLSIHLRMRGVSMPGAQNIFCMSTKSTAVSPAA